MVLTMRQFGTVAVLVAGTGIWFGEPFLAALGLVWVALTALLVRQEATRHRRLRAAAARALEQASVEHEQQRCIFDALEQSVALSAVDGEVLLLNGAAERLLGYTAEELTAKVRSGEWETYDEDGSVVPPTERPIWRTVATGEPVRDQVMRWRRKDGQLVIVRVATQPVRDVDGVLTRVVTAFSDVTAERAIAHELETTQARFAALVEQSTDLICILGRDGSLVYASPAAERLLGHTDVALLGRPFSEFLHPDDASAVLEAYQELIDSPGSVVRVDTRVITADGSWRNMEIAATNRLDDPAVAGIVANARDVTERAEAAARLTWQAFHDPLTGLANRALLLDRLGNALDRSRRTPRTTALMFLDLDDFKVVNDTLGHAAGDQLLVEVGRRLSSLLRSGDTVARLGGDEFIVLAESLDAPAEATAIAARIIELLAQPISVAGTDVLITASLGVAFDRDHEPDRLLREADSALYRAKALGKRRYEVFADEPDGPKGPATPSSGAVPEDVVEALRVS